jgi:membrane protein YdbS with pleckstrin-like domain
MFHPQHLTISLTRIIATIVGLILGVISFVMWMFTGVPYILPAAAFLLIVYGIFGVNWIADINKATQNKSEDSSQEE